MQCCFCNHDVGEWGNNPWPYFAYDDNARCCDSCNCSRVLVARLKGMGPIEADLRLRLEGIIK